MARTFKLDSKGDIIFDNIGRISWIDDEERIVQSINLRLKTYKEELFYNEDYGFEKIKGKISLDELRSRITDTILQDEEIDDVDILEISKIPGNPFGYQVSCEITLVEQGIIIVSDDIEF